jgi:hypothetical protein
MPSIVLARAEDADEFVAFLRMVHVRIVTVDGAHVVAEVPGAPSPLHEHRELAGYVATWSALNPGRAATLAEPGASPEARRP